MRSIYRKILSLAKIEDRKMDKIEVRQVKIRKDAGKKLTRTHPQMDENFKAVAIWKNYDSRIHIRRRIWIREI